MQCANPHCSEELLYLRQGRVELIELELDSRDRGLTDEGGFPVKSAPSKFFWLCGGCAKKLIVKRWTRSGLVLGLRKEIVAGRRVQHRAARTSSPEACAIAPTSQLQSSL
jgi:hypothetical protein